MKQIRFSEEQIISVLRAHGEGTEAADLARKHGISEVTYARRADALLRHLIGP